MKSQIIIATVIGGLIVASLLNSCSGPPEKIGHKSHTVEIKGMQFQPGEIRIKSGDTVTFINKDILVHNVTEEQNKSWASPSLSTDQSYSVVITGTSNYYCTIHPVMKGKVIVE